MNDQFAEKTILIVEDDIDTSKMLAYLLKSIGIKKIHSAKDGIDALSIMSTIKNIDCIISDWNMPRKSGIEFFRNTQQNSRYQKIPFLMLTTESQKDKVEEAIQLGITDYIIKPFTSFIIESKLKKILNLND